MTVTNVLTESVQPLPFVTIYRIVSVPFLTPVKIPVLMSIVAKLVSKLIHCPPTVASVSVTVLFTHTSLGPLMTPISGKALTVIAESK